MTCAHLLPLLTRAAAHAGILAGVPPHFSSRRPCTRPTSHAQHSPQPNPDPPPPRPTSRPAARARGRTYRTAVSFTPYISTTLQLWLLLLLSRARSFFFCASFDRIQVAATVSASPPTPPPSPAASPAAALPSWALGLWPCYCCCALATIVFAVLSGAINAALFACCGCV